jgi:3-methyladenine DNA glycosylase AlkD
LTCNEIVRIMESKRNQANVDGMARFGIRSDKVLGLCMPDIVVLAKRIGKDHKMALALWDTGIYDARVLAALVDEPKKVTRRQMERWALDFDNWGVCDNACMHLFDRASCVWEVVPDWCRREEEFVRRAGFAIIASLTIHDKKAGDERFLAILPLIREASTDERPMVRKAVNWALRQIGKRNAELNKAAIAEAKAIKAIPSKSARWIASDALRELEGEKVQERLAKKRLKAKR